MMELPLPVDLIAERATLGSFLMVGDSISLIATTLVPDDFYLEKHAWVYEAGLACFHRRESVSLMTIASELRRQGRLESIGGMTFLGELFSCVVSELNIEYYARYVKDTATRRAIIEMGGKITARAYRENESLAETLSYVQGLVLDVSNETEHRGPTSLTVEMNEIFTTMTDIQNGHCLPSGLQTQFLRLNEMTGGLQAGDLIVLAARPAVGKTSFALSLASYVASEGGRVLFFSLEMSRKQIAERLLSMETQIPSHRLRNANLNDDELNAIVDSCGKIANLPLQVDDSSVINTTDMMARAKRLSIKSGLDFIVIDYLQLVSALVKTNNRVQDVSEISRNLKILAQELKVPVLALSQLNRSVESRQTKIPMLSDLRESGSIEQDADVVMFLYREELYNKETLNKGIVEVHVAKHRNGPLGYFKTSFDSESTFFGELDLTNLRSGL